MKRCLIMALLAASLGLGGCAQLPRGSVVKVEPLSMPDVPAVEPNGAIFQPQRGFMPLFEDRRPRRVGDVITIVLNEEVSASKNASANASRNGSASLTFGELAEALQQLEEYGFDIAGANEFSARGGAQANNRFTGTITVLVREILPNGNLKVAGEKQIAINQGTEYIRFSGVVNPRHITGKNTVPSTEVAEARIEYVGDGYIHEAQHMGWLQRLFLNLSPF
jgi:flagellar L-ring protein FlgH